MWAQCTANIHPGQADSNRVVYSSVFLIDSLKGKPLFLDMSQCSKVLKEQAVPLNEKVATLLDIRLIYLFLQFKWEAIGRQLEKNSSNLFF